MYNLLFLNVQSDDPCKTARITHDIKTSTIAQDHVTSNDSIIINDSITSHIIIYFIQPMCLAFGQYL